MPQLTQRKNALSFAQNVVRNDGNLSERKLSDVDLLGFREIIEDAFSNVPYPGDNAIADFSAVEHLEANAVAKCLRGKRWQDFDLPSFEKCEVDRASMIFFLSPKAFHYYFPAFLLLVLEHYREVDLLSDVVVGVLKKLRVRKLGDDVVEFDIGSHYAGRFSLFTVTVHPPPVLPSRASRSTHPAPYRSFHRCGNSSSMFFILCVGSRVSTSFRYAYGSRSFRRAD